jgi:hypothetical protein
MARHLAVQRAQVLFHGRYIDANRALADSKIPHLVQDLDLEIVV